MVIFSLLSVALIYAATKNAQTAVQGENSLYRQIIFIIAGFGIYFAAMTVDLKLIHQKGVQILIFAITGASLLYVLLFGEVIQNTQRWIAIGTFSLQPAEFAKLTIVLISASLFARQHNIASQTEFGQLKIPSWVFTGSKFMVSALAAISFAVLIFLQPSLGNALILVIIWLVQIFFALRLDDKVFISIGVGILISLMFYKIGIFEQIGNLEYWPSYVWQIFTGVTLAAAVVLLWKLWRKTPFLLIAVTAIALVLPVITDYTYKNVLKDYHRSRIESYLNGFNSDPKNKDYQVRQSVITIGNGQLFGNGFLNGKQINSGVLPFAHTDFIFATYAEQFGFVGVLILLMLYAFLGLRILLIAIKSSSSFAKHLCVGVLALIMVNIVINLGMNMGMLPVTGVPLPLLSSGGSSVLLVCLSLGLVQATAIRNKPLDLAEKIGWKGL